MSLCVYLTSFSSYSMRINEVWHCVACRGLYAIKSTKPNLRTF